MTDDSQPDPSRWDGPIPGDPDPEIIGPALTAWYALHDSLAGDPADTLAWAADVIATRLGAFGPGVVNPLPPSQVSAAIEDAKLLLGMIAEIFGRASQHPLDIEAAPAFKAELKRHRGRPAKTGELRPRSLAWWGVASEVQKLIDEEGMLQKEAVGVLAKRHGLKDAVVARWCRQRRQALDRGREWSGDTEKSAIYP